MPDTLPSAWIQPDRDPREQVSHCPRWPGRLQGLIIRPGAISRQQMAFSAGLAAHWTPVSVTYSPVSF